MMSGPMKRATDSRILHLVIAHELCGILERRDAQQRHAARWRELVLLKQQGLAIHRREVIRFGHVAAGCIAERVHVLVRATIRARANGGGCEAQLIERASRQARAIVRRPQISDDADTFDEALLDQSTQHHERHL